MSLDTSSNSRDFFPMIDSDASVIAWLSDGELDVNLVNSTVVVAEPEPEP